METTLAERHAMVMERIARACARAGRQSDSVTLIAVTKTHPVSFVQEVIDLGIQHIGENRVQEIEEKVPHLTGTFTMHLIGHLQTNKVGKVIPLAHWIQSIDSIKLLEKVETKAQELGARPSILVQVNTSGEESKSGCSPEEALDLCARARESDHLAFRGLMTIGPLGGTERQTRDSFGILRGIREKLPTQALELSMGMSQDFEWAIEEGATMVRIGSLLLERSYRK